MALFSKQDKDPLTRAEWKVMRIVWRLKRCAARDVYTEAGDEHGWSTSTVKTMLRRLVDKGYLNTEQVGNSFLYRPARSAITSLRGAADTLLDNALEGTTGAVIAHMVKRSELSPGEVAELRALLDSHAPKIPTKTPNNAKEAQQ